MVFRAKTPIFIVRSLCKIAHSKEHQSHWQFMFDGIPIIEDNIFDNICKELCKLSSYQSFN
jgi:hypothetical protein